MDARRSAVAFTVKHLMDGSVKGQFCEFEGALEVDRQGGNVRAHGIVKVESLDTGVVKRDTRLLSPELFDVDRYPEIRYLMLAFRPAGDDSFRVLGELTIRDVLRQVLFTGKIEGPVRDPSGEERVSVELTGRLSRKEFGLGWNEFVDESPVVGDTVRFAIDLLLFRPCSPPNDGLMHPAHMDIGDHGGDEPARG